MTVPSVRGGILPAELRGPLAVVVGIATTVFVVLTVRYAGGDTPGRLDLDLARLIGPIGAESYGVVNRTTVLGSPPAVVVVSIALAVVCLAVRRWRLAVLAIAGPGLTGVATTLLKPAIGRTIGDANEFAFPSGHTGGATALGLVAAFLLVSVLRPGKGAALGLLAGGALLGGVVVGLSVVAVNAHYPTDAVGGFCTAVVVVSATALLLDRIPVRLA